MTCATSPCADRTTRAMPSMDSSATAPPSRFVRSFRRRASRAHRLHLATETRASHRNVAAWDARAERTAGKKGTSAWAFRNSSARRSLRAKRLTTNSLSWRVVSPAAVCTVNAVPVGSRHTTSLSRKFTLTQPSSRSTARRTSGTAEGSTSGVGPARDAGVSSGGRGGTWWRAYANAILLDEASASSTSSRVMRGGGGDEAASAASTGTGGEGERGCASPPVASRGTRGDDGARMTEVRACEFEIAGRRERAVRSAARRWRAKRVSK